MQGAVLKRSLSEQGLTTYKKIPVWLWLLEHWMTYFTGWSLQVLLGAQLLVISLAAAVLPSNMQVSPAFCTCAYALWNTCISTKFMSWICLYYVPVCIVTTSTARNVKDTLPLMEMSTFLPILPQTHNYSTNKLLCIKMYRGFICLFSVWGVCEKQVNEDSRWMEL